MEWIAIKDRLPTHEGKAKDYLIMTNGGQIRIETFWGEINKHETHRSFEMRYLPRWPIGDRKEDFLYWSELPELSIKSDDDFIVQEKYCWYENNYNPSERRYNKHIECSIKLIFPLSPYKKLTGE